MVLPTLVAAGMETMVAQLALGLARAGHDVGVTATEAVGPLAGSLTSAGIPVNQVPARGLLTNVWPTDLARWLTRRAPDVMHVHSGVWLKAARAARMAGVPVVVHTVHGLLDVEPKYGPALKRIAARLTDSVVTVSDPLREYITGEVGIPSSRVHLIANGVDTTRFAPGARSGALRASLGIPADAPLVGIVARLAPVKNHSLLVDAFALVRERRPDAHLVLVGEGEERALVERRIADLSLGDRVHLAGARADTADVYRELDVNVLCSIAEGTSISLLEAMSTAVGCVATSVGGNTDLLDGGCGLLVPSRDAAALADAIVRLLDDDSSRRALGAAARARVLERYSLDAMVRAYEAIYSR
jgi:glycosyltransferase involved in cell wall biosynthesis